MLEILLSKISEVYLETNQPYLALLYRTLFITAYFGLFRISELTDSSSSHAVKAADVQIGFNKKKFMFILRSSKTHGEDSKPQIVKISSTVRTGGKINKPGKSRFTCPYLLLRDYSRA